ncbi:MAG: 8-oxo-dGTP diphosphatase MutT [Pseudomonadales bacterium]
MSKSAEVVQVAAAVILDGRGNVFLARRAKEQHQGGLWEFPGGKIERDETAEQALRRELEEEIGIVIERAEPFWDIAFDYPDKSVHLQFFVVRHFSGEPYGKEGQQTAWFEREQLKSLAFPKANQPVVDKLMSDFSHIEV